MHKVKYSRFEDQNILGGAVDGEEVVPSIIITYYTQNSNKMSCVSGFSSHLIKCQYVNENGYEE